MKPKPIVLIKLPYETTNGEMDSFAHLGGQMPDYHVLIMTADVPEMDFKVFYEKDFTKVKHDELVKIIKEAVK